MQSGTREIACAAKLRLVMREKNPTQADFDFRHAYVWLC